jgi:hypothetical protein
LSAKGRHGGENHRKTKYMDKRLGTTMGAVNRAHLFT